MLMVYVHEAHTRDWPVGAGNDSPAPCTTFEDRVGRARAFARNWPTPVYVDAMDGRFERAVHAWPDRYYCVTRTGCRLLASSTYDGAGVVHRDVTDFFAPCDCNTATPAMEPCCTMIQCEK